MICKNCGKEIIRIKGQSLREFNIKQFCNRSCAASYNNKFYVKRKRKPKKERFCKKCGIAIGTDRKTTCESCNKNIVDWSLVSYQEATDRRAYQINSRIRDLARRAYFNSDRPKKCICGYDKHIEICHIKPINSFSKESMISEINHINNLVALCPNCHWEFDNGFLNL